MVPYQKQNRAMFQFAGLFRSFDRQVGRNPLFPAFAQPVYRAIFTIRHPVRDTDGCAQFHQTLIKRPRLQYRHHLSQLISNQDAGCRVGNVRMARGDPRDHTQYVSVHRRLCDPIGDGGDRPRRIGADSRQGKKCVIIGGQLSAILRNKDLCCLLQVAGAVIIAKPFPEL